MTLPLDPSVSAAVLNAVAAYAQALDAGRTDDLAALFTPDGVAEIVGSSAFTGRDAIREGYAAFAPSAPQLHLVANTVVTPASEDEVTAVSDLAFLHRGKSGWRVQLTGRYDDTLRRTYEGWRFTRRVLTLSP
ncbi:nuclear transport factor 2 family protein [Blastococcus sp. URHD0036]|uniref:nuclear transport factor 2 family protein n=1 Tax=Blastococcus sp. URHD0036 TaxID=1380356 RepID=UPI0004971E0B|nr:nuclear transport factor 2 family protein [Blastococcus sp. URHD0036]